MNNIQWMVYQTISRAEVNKINFRVEGTAISFLHFLAVRQALNDNVIGATHTPTMGSRSAKYSFKWNKFRFGFNSIAGDIDLESLIVHEATHAALDLCKNKTRKRVSEGIAYISQCLYYYYRNRLAIDSGHLSLTTGNNAILTAAWALSKKVRQGDTLMQNDMQPLYTALDAHPLYKDKLDDYEPMNG